MKMQVAVFLLIAAFLTRDVNAQIPKPCATIESLTARTCCPVPAFENAGACGVNLGRGSCELIAIPDSDFDAEQMDVRMKWPIQYFNSTCVCNERYGGYDCGECSYAYNDGTTECTEKTIRPRISAGDMTDGDWDNYREAIMKAKVMPSRYMVVTINFTTDLQALVDFMVNPSPYDLFIWMHHTAAKDNDLTINTENFLDFAHESTGFPTWHRLYLLWIEREIQIMIGNHTFRLPYWDWRDPMQRDVLFQRDRLGVNINGNVEGDLFDDDKWQTICWEDIEGQNPPLPICNPDQPSGQNLRRCPNATLCDKNNMNWPSYEDIATAIAIDSYDTSPYDRFVEDTDNSYRNYMEGFVTKPGKHCGDNTMCTVDEIRNVTVSRKIHNTVHIILGIGDLRSGPSIPFQKAGVMLCVAASPNDPSFINHHGMIDCILEEWLQRNKDKLSYPMSDEIREGHRADDYIVPIMPLQMHKDMFKTADNFGYSCSLPDADGDGPDDDDKSGSVSVQAYVSLMIGLLAVAVAHISIP